MARQLERWAPLGGIIFVVLMVVGTMFVADVPAPAAPQQQLASYLADSGNHTRNIMGAYIWVVGALAFLWFVGRLRSVLREPKGARAPCRTWSSAPGSSSPPCGWCPPRPSRRWPMPSGCEARP